jgi:hypothetical protein
MPGWYADAWKLPKDEMAKLRSKTFPGIAQAMTTQWTNFMVRLTANFGLGEVPLLET